MMLLMIGASPGYLLSRNLRAHFRKMGPRALRIGTNQVGIIIPL
jgi:hypothetical protein